MRFNVMLAVARDAQYAATKAGFLRIIQKGGGVQEELAVILSLQPRLLFIARTSAH